jgi:hypothetical protein
VKIDLVPFATMAFARSKHRGAFELGAGAGTSTSDSSRTSQRDDQQTDVCDVRSPGHML